MQFQNETETDVEVALPMSAWAYVAYDFRKVTRQYDVASPPDPYDKDVGQMRWSRLYASGPKSKAAVVFSNHLQDAYRFRATLQAFSTPWVVLCIAGFLDKRRMRGYEHFTRLCACVRKKLLGDSLGDKLWLRALQLRRPCPVTQPGDVIAAKGTEEGLRVPPCSKYIGAVVQSKDREPGLFIFRVKRGKVSRVESVHGLTPKATYEALVGCRASLVTLKSKTGRHHLYVRMADGRTLFYVSTVGFHHYSAVTGSVLPSAYTV